MSVPAHLLDLLAKMHAGKRVELSFYAVAKLEEAGLLVESSIEESGWRLTAEGEAAGCARHETNEAARRKRNRAARGRTSAMKSLGLTRTPYGWE